MDSFKLLTAFGFCHLGLAAPGAHASVGRFAGTDTMLSVVIATHNCERALVLTLAPLVAGAAEGVIREVIVTDAGSGDQTAAVADMAGCRLLVSPGSIAVRLGTAIASARAPWLMILRPGVVLDATWTGEVSRFMAESEASAGRDLSAAVFRAVQRGNGGPAAMLREAFGLIRAALGRRPRPDQGLVMPRALYDRIGGYRADVAFPESDLLRRLGGRRIVTLRCAALSVDCL
jgi:glycosyltransferase involved in cell wall biosynthesis